MKREILRVITSESGVEEYQEYQSHVVEERMHRRTLRPCDQTLGQFYREIWNMQLHQLVALQVGKLHQLGMNEVSLSAAELWDVRTGLDNRKMHDRSSYIQG